MMNEDNGFCGSCDDVPVAAVQPWPEYQEPRGNRSHPADWGWPEWWGSHGWGDSWIPPRSEWPEGWRPAT